MEILTSATLANFLRVVCFDISDYLSKLLPAKVERLLKNILNQCTDKMLGLFFEHCVQSMVNDMGKGDANAHRSASFGTYVVVCDAMEQQIRGNYCDLFKILLQR